MQTATRNFSNMPTARKMIKKLQKHSLVVWANANRIQLTVEYVNDEEKKLVESFGFLSE